MILSSHVEKRRRRPLWVTAWCWYCAVVVTMAMVTFLGCANVKEKKSFDFALPKSQMNEGAVALQIAVVQLDTDQQAMFTQFWNQLDPMTLPLSVRRSADRNGLRYAVMPPQCPAVLDALLERRALDLGMLTGLQKQMAEKGLLESPTRYLTHQRIENDRGEECEITVSDYLQKADWKVVLNERLDQVETGQGDLVKGVVQFSTFPRSDGSVRLVVEPEVHHGRPQQRYNVSQRTFLFSESQIETRIDALKFAVDLKPGESLVIAPLQSEVGPEELESELDADSEAGVGSVLSIGELFFGENAASVPVDASGAAPASAELSIQSPESSEIEALFAEVDQALLEDDAFDLILDAQTERDQQADQLQGASANERKVPAVKPMFRFMMVRLVHTQMCDLFDDDSQTQRLTTINHQ